VGAVAEGLFGDGQEDEPAAFHALDFAFGDGEFGRVDEIVGGVDVHDVGLDGFEFGGGIVIARGIDGVEKIVGVESGGEARHGGGKIFIGGIAGGEIFLHVEGSAAGDDQKIGGNLQGGTRLRGCSRHFSSRDPGGCPSITILRQMRLRPAICTGWQARGIRASMKSV